MLARISPLGMLSLLSALAAALALIGYLVRRPPLSAATKLWLLLGLGVLPITAAFTGNLEGYQATKQRSFCGSCHVMTPYSNDSDDPKSMSLAARHGRNKLFGGENCYTCHADYGMFGTVTTKLAGLGHVERYLLEFRNVSLEQARERIHIHAPYPNDNCMQCHSTTLDLWQRTPDHRASIEDVRAGRMSCASAGCHGHAHPFSKPPPGPSASAPTPAGSSAPREGGR